MTTFTGVVVFFLIWWVVLFAVLPIGTRPVAEADEVSGWRGAPARPRFWRTVLITTVVTAVLWGLCYWLITSDWLSFRHGFLRMPDD